MQALAKSQEIYNKRARLIIEALRKHSGPVPAKEFVKETGLTMAALCSRMLPRMEANKTVVDGLVVRRRIKHGTTASSLYWVEKAQ